MFTGVPSHLRGRVLVEVQQPLHCLVDQLLHEHERLIPVQKATEVMLHGSSGRQSQRARRAH